MSTHTNPFAPLPRTPGIDITPRPRTITTHTAASAFLDTRTIELTAGLDMLAHATGLALGAGNVEEAARLLAEAAPLREQLASIQALVAPAA